METTLQGNDPTALATIANVHRAVRKRMIAHWPKEDPNRRVLIELVGWIEAEACTRLREAGYRTQWEQGIGTDNEAQLAWTRTD